jgi:hypothetical protein
MTRVDASDCWTGLVLMRTGMVPIVISFAKQATDVRYVARSLHSVNVTM